MLKRLCPYIEIALSLLLLGATIYQGFIGGKLFFLVSSVFLIDAVIYVLALFQGKAFSGAIFRFADRHRGGLSPLESRGHPRLLARL